MGRDGALADRRGPCEHHEAGADRARHRLREALVEPSVERLALSRAQPAQPLDRGDLEIRHDLVALARADRGERRQELGHPQGARGGSVIGFGPPQDFLGRDDARSEIALDARARAARGNGLTRRGQTIDLGWSYDLTH
jgi:hypothetical protein